MYKHQSICLDTQFKQRLGNVKSTVQEKLGVGVSTTNAYDIMAVSQGFENYQTAKGRSVMPYYEWGTNIGTPQKPYFVKKPIGHHRSRDEAQKFGEPLLLESPDDIVWMLFENGEMTNVSLCRHKKPSQLNSTNIRSFIDEAINRNITEIRLHQDNSKQRLEVGHRSRKGWVDDVYVSSPEDFSDLEVMSQLKTLASYDGDDVHPSELSFVVANNGVNVDVRVATFPTQTGRIFVIRLLDPRVYKSNGSLLEASDAFNKFRNDINQFSNGLFLIVGEAGSGKTTTSSYLASQMQKHNKSKPALMDDTINSLDFKNEINKLSQSDKDVIFTGEIRTHEILEAAVDAANDKVVIAELHSTDVNVLKRLEFLLDDMTPLNNVLKGVFSQTLLRSEPQGAIIPVCSFQRTNNNYLVGTKLLEEAVSLHKQGKISYEELYGRFGPLLGK